MADCKETEKQSSYRLSNVDLLDIVSSKHSLSDQVFLSPYLAPFSNIQQEKIPNKTPSSARGPPLYEPSLDYEDFVLFPPASTTSYSNPIDSPTQFCSCHPSLTLPQRQQQPATPLLPLIPTIANPTTHISPTTFQALNTLPSPSPHRPSHLYPVSSPTNSPLAQCHCLPPTLLNIGSHLAYPSISEPHISFECSGLIEDDELDLDLEMSEVKAVSIDEYISKRQLSSLSEEEEQWDFMR